MGSTVTTGRTAAAFRTTSGTTMYCLYEETYEKNCYPHTPHWSAIYIGEITGAFQKIFDYASSCEGGMLQNRSGHLSPEGYLRSWMSKLSAPVRITHDITVELYAKTKSIYAPLSEETVPAIAATLLANGLHDAPAQLQAGNKVLLSLFEHGELISLLHNEHHIPAWTLLPQITVPLTKTGHDPSLGIPSKKSKIPAPHYQPARIVSQYGDIILQEADGAWRCYGSQYEIMSSYIRNLAPVEQANPGSYHSLIQSYRNYLKATPKATPDRLIVQIDKTLLADKYQRDRVEEAAKLPGATLDGNILSIPFTTEHEYTLSHLPKNATTWRVLDEQPTLHQAALFSQSGDDA